MTFDSSKLKTVVVAILALFAALYLGITAATAQRETAAWVLGAASIVIAIWMGQRIWMLLPLMGALDISLRIPGQPSTLLVAQFAVIGMSVILLLMRKLPFQLKFTELEFLMFLIIAFVAQAYLRNPVGISLFGSDNVGGKPYFIFAISCVTALLISGLRIPSGQIQQIFRLSVVGGLLNLFIGIAGYLIPTVGFYTNTYYVGSASFDNRAIDTGAAGRIGILSTFSRNLSLWISCYISPVAAMVQPLWGILCLVSIAAGAASGFRTAIATVAATLLIGTLYRGGRVQVLLGMFAGVGLVALLAVANLLHPLPPSAQRALSFLPGTWEERYIDDTKGSTDWRTEVWIEALTSEKYIRNKWFGDGLGFSRQDLDKSMAITAKTAAGYGGWDAQREAVLLNGDYHSSAVSTVRTCGYAGLIVLVYVMIRVAILAHREIRRARGSWYYPVALFIGFPPIIALIMFPISASTFLQVASALFISISYLRLLQNNRPVEPA